MTLGTTKPLLAAELFSPAMQLLAVGSEDNYKRLNEVKDLREELEMINHTLRNEVGRGE